MLDYSVTGMQGISIFLFVVAIFGSLHLLVASFPDNLLSRAWAGLGF